MKRFLSVVLALVVAIPILAFPLAQPVAAQGNAWTLHTALGERYDLCDVWGSSPADVWAIGYDDVAENGVIFHYNGTDWTIMTSPTSGGFSGVWGSAWNDVWAVGGDGVFHYNGSSWEPTPYTLMQNDVWGSSPADVWAVGHMFDIAHYLFGTWSTYENPSYEWLYGVWGSSSDDVWAVGQMGTIIHYGGFTWENVGWPDNRWFEDVWGSAWNDVYAVSTGGPIHYDGVSWTDILTEPTPYGFAVWGSSANDVFVVGDRDIWEPGDLYPTTYGAIYHYDGAEWTLTISSATTTLQGVWGSSPTDVWAVGDNGIILHYGPAATEPDISVSPPSHGFGDVIVGNSSTPLEVTISNTGTAALTVTNMVLSDTINYSLNVNGGSEPAGSTTPVIPAGESRTVTVTFSPTSIGTLNANLTIDSDDPDTPSVNVSLTGNGIAAPVPDTVILSANPTNIPANGTSTSTLTATVKDQYGDPVEDGTDVVFNTDHGSLGSGTVTKQTSGGVATATLTSESSTETVIATVTATADGVSDATAVFFIPEGEPGVEQSETETVTDSGTLENTPTGGDVSIDATGDHIITTAKYEDNPGGTPTFQATGDYYDVHLDDDTGVNSLTIEFCPATEDTVIYYWDGASWLPCELQTYSDGCIVVTITDSTSPSLSDLTGLVFAPGVSEVSEICVDIDIKPGSDPNSINLKSKGVVPVAVLTTGDFDASTIDPSTVLFADAQPVRWTLEDVDSDGDLDMLFHFKTQDLNLIQNSTEATLIGETDGGQSIEGTDTVKIVPKSK